MDRGREGGRGEKVMMTVLFENSHVRQLPLPSLIPLPLHSHSPGPNCQGDRETLHWRPTALLRQERERRPG